MKEAPFPYLQHHHKSTKPEMNHQKSHQSHHRSASVRGGDAQMTLQSGQVIFRFLCHVNTAGGVIGNSGFVIKQLENQTGSKIRFEEPLPNCHERVINVIGESVLNKKIPLNFELGPENEDFKVEVSRAQEGLVRVFERVLEVEGNGNGVVGCRLLAAPGQIGAVMGKGGKIVDAIRRNSGAKIRVLKKDQIPACAAPEEELIQIMGDVVAVKKALVAVSRRLQDCTPGETLHTSSYGAFHNVHLDFIPEDNTTQPCCPGDTNDRTSVGNTLSADVDRILSLDQGSNQRKVVFRLLCSNSSAGGVIGKGANIVKALEKETGASIKFSSPVARLKERVATISSLENPDPLYSPAQVATIRVFSRSVQVSIDQGIIQGLGEGISARIIVAPSQIDCLTDEGGKVASEISAASGVEIQLLGANLVPDASEDDKVLQIIGEYDNVKSVLFQVTGRLRDKLFASMTPEGAEPRCYSYSAVPDSSLYRKGGPDSLGLQGKEFKNMRKNTMLEDGARGQKASGGGLEKSSVDLDAATIRTVEILVPEKAFGSVYGENGSNLDRLKEISGAAVILQDPSPGKCDGKVIISGTPERIQIAQSLLQAFLLT